MTYVIALRTHLWDDDIEKVARDLREKAVGSRFVILADETKGPLATGSFEKVSHTTDFSSFGLPEYPLGRSLSYNGDYPLYALESAFPDADYFVMSEYDVVVNTDVTELVNLARARGLDLIGHDIRWAGPDWFWYNNGRASYEQPHRSLIFFVVISRQAVERLREARQARASMSTEPDWTWPFCETFVPSTVAALGMSWAELSEFVLTTNLRLRPHMLSTDPRTRIWDSIAHPVLGRERFFKAVLSEYNALDYFEENSDLRQILKSIPLKQIQVPLLDKLIAQRAHGGVSKLREAAYSNGLSLTLEGGDPHDLALCRPARSSSVSSFSYAQDAEIDAAGANTIRLEPEYGFHTLLQNEPWWMVDLEGKYLIDQVEIINRQAYDQRFRRFVIEGSLDGLDWTAHTTKLDDDPVSFSESDPWVFRAHSPGVARFLRIRALGETILHLRNIKVRGRMSA